MTFTFLLHTIYSNDVVKPLVISGIYSDKSFLMSITSHEVSLEHYYMGLIIAVYILKFHIITCAKKI